MTRTVNEKSPLYMTLTFKDENGDPTVPTTVDWRLDNQETGALIVDWTSLPGVAATMTHVIPASYNVIVDETSHQEERIFSIRVDDGLATEAHSQFKYHVINLCAPTGV